MPGHWQRGDGRVTTVSVPRFSCKPCFLTGVPRIRYAGRLSVLISPLLFQRHSRFSPPPYRARTLFAHAKFHTSGGGDRVTVLSSRTRTEHALSQIPCPFDARDHRWATVHPGPTDRPCAHVDKSARFEMRPNVILKELTSYRQTPMTKKNTSGSHYTRKTTGWLPGRRFLIL